MDANKAFNTPCFDHSEHCAAWKLGGECLRNERFMAISCSHSCGTCASTARAPPLPPLPHDNMLEVADAACKDEHADCAYWAQHGECSKNAAFMRAGCPESCRTCIELELACARVEGSKAIARELGGLNALFERALAEFPAYSPRALSREPWLLEFEDFVSPQEAAVLIRLANASLVRSLAGDAVSPVRTSKQFWCSTQECLDDAHVAAVTARVAAVTGVPAANMEYLQLLRYQPDEFYKSHHDQVGRAAQRRTCARAAHASRLRSGAGENASLTPRVTSRPRPRAELRAVGPAAEWSGCSPSTFISTTWRRAAARASPTWASPCSRGAAGRCSGRACSTASSSGSSR